MTPAEREPLPKQLGDFDIVGELGRGGMGVVYQARQRSLNRRVALKVLASSLGLTPRAIERFQREATAAAKLHHTNIIPIYATGEQDGIHYYVMEMIDGPSLDRVLRALRQAAKGAVVETTPLAETAVPGWLRDSMAYAQQLEPASASGSGSGSLGSGSAYFDTVANLLAAVADALEHAHQHGVVHRDIKPSNLLLSADGKLSLSDFGLARMLEQPGMTQTGEFVGTPAYMSPEQIAAGRVLVDHRTDIYSLGATLYELLTLQPPFQAERRDQMLTQILTKEPTSPRRLQKQIPVDLETICLKALDKDADRRYQHARELAEDLRCYVNRFAIKARRVGVVEKLWKWTRRHPALTGALACLLLAVATAGYFAYRAVEGERLAAEQLAKEQQQQLAAALEETTVLVLRGKFDEASQRLEAAVKLGAPEGEILLRRGLIALQRGQAKDAMTHLQRAVELLPRSQAARAMLLRTYHDVGRFDEFYASPLWVQVEQLPSQQALDYLFHGQVLAVINPARGAAALDKAVDLADYALPRRIRAEARTRYAQMTGDLEHVARALQDVNVARDLLGNEAPVLRASLEASLCAACVYERQKNDERKQAMLAEAAKDVKALECAPNETQVERLCMIYYAYTDNKAAIRAAYQREQPRNGGAVTGRFYLHQLYRAGRFTEALAVLEQMPRQGNEIMYHMRRAFILANLGSEGPAQARAELTKGAAAGKGIAVGGRMLYLYLVLELLGDKEQVTQLYRDTARAGVRMASDPRFWYQKVAEYRGGLRTEEQLLAEAGSSLLLQCEAHFFIGMRHLAGGDRAGARQHFEASKATRILWFLEYEWSINFLAQLDRDPLWPRWIK